MHKYYSGGRLEEGMQTQDRAAQRMMEVKQILELVKI